MSITTGPCAPPAAPDGQSWWPDLALAPEPVLPPDPETGWVPARPVEPAGWWTEDVTVYDLIDPADRADLDRLTRTDWPDALNPADPAGLAAVVARVADGAAVTGAPVGLVAAVSALAGVGVVNRPGSGGGFDPSGGSSHGSSEEVPGRGP